MRGLLYNQFQSPINLQNFINRYRFSFMAIISWIIVFALFCSDSLAQAPNAELIDQRTEIVLKNNRLIKNVSYEVRINNKEGEKYAKVEIPYSKMIKLTKVEASVKDISGAVIKKLSKNDITNRSAISESSLYEDDYIQEFTLKHNSYPYLVDYSYQLVQDQYFIIDHWIPVLSRTVPTDEAKLTIEVPADYRIRFKNILTGSFKIDSTESELRYSWTASYKTLVQPESYSPSEINFFPNVVVVPEKFLFDQAGSYKSWQEFGEWHYSLFKDITELTPTENGRILSVIGGVSDKREIIKRLFRYLQENARYINIRIETGGFKPYPAAFVAENKYGDCKALCNYFRAVLRVAGIESFYTLVNAGDPIRTIDKDFPSQQFNHVILSVPLLTDTLWLDCTGKYPVNYLGTFTQGRTVFIVDDTKSHFTKTPSFSFPDVEESRSVKVHQSTSGQAIAEFSNTYRGEEFEGLSYMKNYISSREIPETFGRNFVAKGFELINMNIGIINPDSPQFRLSYTAKSSGVYKNYGNDLIIEVLPFDLPDLELPGKRKLPVQIDYPIYKTDSLEYEIPAGNYINSELVNEEIKSEYGRYSVSSLDDGHKLKIVKSFLLNKGEYDLSRYEGLFGFIKKVNDIEKSDKIVSNEKK